MNAEYRCNGCGHAWHLAQPSQVTCPKCNHLYVKWVNFDAWRKANPIEHTAPQKRK